MDASSSQHVRSEPGNQSHFGNLPPVPVDEAFHFYELYARDTNSDKVTLGGGVYRTDQGEPWPLPAVEQAEARLFEQADPSRHDYLAIAGDVEFLKVAQHLIFGLSETDSANQARIASVQTISGSGANHTGALFLARHLNPRRVWLSDPTWINHRGIWEMVAVQPEFYPYYDPVTMSVDFDGMVRTLKTKTNPGDVVLLQPCAHNPTGIDPTHEQWKHIAEICQRRRLFPFFDSAYQGFASGDPGHDAWPIQYFLDLDMEMCVAQSFSKNFGLYGQRVGAFHIVTTHRSSEFRDSIFQSLCGLIRGEYSMAPRAGAAIVKTVLSNGEMRDEWLKNLKTMSERISKMRRALYNALLELKTPGSWDHILTQAGMFSYLGLSAEQVVVLREKYHIYALSSGRACISGLTPRNVEYVAKAIDDVVKTIKPTCISSPIRK